MDLPRILPPTDLLEEYKGIKSGLEKRRRLGGIGWIVFLIASAFETFVVVANSEYAQALWAFDWRTLAGDYWFFLLPILVAVLSVLLSTWSRFWLKESRSPFRYTCTVAEFTEVTSGQSTGTTVSATWSWLTHDLTKMFSERIGRLRFIPSERKEATSKDSHVRISGHFGFRRSAHGRWLVEVMPRVQVGSVGETLAHVVTYSIGSHMTSVRPDSLPVAAYKQIVERVYSSVATELYKQIQLDVAGKIALLPTDYFRGVALFCEADDYSRSNTLAAFEQASKLYERSFLVLDPCLRRLPEGPIQRRVAIVWRVAIRLYRLTRRVASFVWPRLARSEVMAAKAEIGYARSLIYHTQLAFATGQEPDRIFSARPYAQHALSRLLSISRDTREHRKSLFEAYVTSALVNSVFGAYRKAEQHLAEARRLDPSRTNRDADYLYVAAECATQRQLKLARLRQAVELAPRFEIAQLKLAQVTEYLWRARPELERNVAELVLEEYDRTTVLNPGNIAAWAHRGYICWLLETDDLDDDARARLHSDALEAFRSGLEYKAIKSTTFVGELHHGLARIAAESGDFLKAYEYYLASVPAHLTHQDRTYYQRSQFAVFGSGIFRRFELYRKRVRAHFDRWKEWDDPHARWWELTGSAGTTDAQGLKELSRLVLGALQLRWTQAGPNLSTLHQALAAPSGSRQRKEAFHMLQSNGLREFISRKIAAAASRHVRKSVLAFVLNDFGEACVQRFHQSGDDRCMESAESAFLECRDLNREYVIPALNLYEIVEQRDIVAAHKYLDEAIRRAPEWQAAQMRQVEATGKLVKRYRDDAEEKRLAAASREAEAERKLADARRTVPASVQSGQVDENVERPLPEVARLRYDAEVLRHEAYRSETESKRLVPRVYDRAHALLPHEWLWVETQSRRFCWEALSSRSHALQFRWEREFGLNHGRALYSLAVAEDTQGNRRRARSLLQHMRRRFWPEDFSIHVLLSKIIVDEVREEVLGDSYLTLLEDPVHQQLLTKNAFVEWVQQVGDPARNPQPFHKDADEAVRRLLRSKPFRRLLANSVYRRLIQFEEVRFGFNKWVLQTLRSSRWIQLIQGADYEFLTREKAYYEILIRERERELLREGRFIWLFLSSARYRRLCRGSIRRARVWGITLRRLLLFADSQTPMRDYIQRELIENNFPYWGLKWLGGEGFSIDQNVLDPTQTSSLRTELLKQATLQGTRTSTYYTWLGENLSQIPETQADAAEAFKKAAASEDPDQLWTIAKGLKSLNRLDQALEVLVRARKFVAKSERAIKAEWEYESEIGLIEWASGRKEKAIRAFENVARIAPPSTHWRQDAVDEIASMLDPDDYLTDYSFLRDWLASEGVRLDFQRDSEAVRDTTEASLRLSSHHLGTHHMLRPQDTVPLTTPIVLEADGSLFPTSEDWSDKHSLFKVLIPGMRKRILNDLGVIVPWVRVRGREDLQDGDYSILLNEVPVAAGRVQADRWFCPSVEPIAAAVAGQHKTVQDPVMPDSTGAWIGPELSADLKKKGVEIYDHFGFMVRHLEIAVRANVALFFGMQEMMNTYHTWMYDDDLAIENRSKLVEKVLNDSPSKIQLLQILVKLLWEQVPIRNLEVILGTFAECKPRLDGATGIDEVAATVRASLATNGSESQRTVS